MAEKLKTIPIKGKDYVMVNDRLKAFRENFPNYSLISEIIKYDEKECVVKASVYDPDAKLVATGHAQETVGSSNINTTSFLENCETSAWGRALGNFGIGIDDSICSAEELLFALEGQKSTEKKKSAKVETKIKEAEGTELPTDKVFDEMLQNKYASEQQIQMIKNISERIGQPLDRICEKYMVTKLEDLTPTQATEVIEKLKGTKQ